MSETVAYCFGCNEQFTMARRSDVCPNCGLPFFPPDSLATLALDEAGLETGSAFHANLAPDELMHLVGQTFDQYEIRQFLGKGGMASVFLAHHRSLHRPCAIKILSPRLREQNERFLELFIAEARSAASVVHPHIVTVHNLGRQGDHHYIELEYVPGTSLQDILNQAQRLTTFDAVKYLSQACAGLAEAHQCGLIHRDFKPSNIMVRPDGVAKLADFGLAKKVSAPTGSSYADSLTGTPYFMAPEVFDGQPASAQSDVYAVGVSLFYLLVGDFPFVDRKITGLAEKHKTATVPDLRQLQPDVPFGIVELIDWCLAKDAAKRPQDGAEVRDILQSIATSLCDLKSLVQQALVRIPNATMDDSHDTIAVTLSWNNGRSQKVFIEETEIAELNSPLVRIYSICAAVTDSFLSDALKLNASLPFGSFAVRPIELDQQDHFVITANYPHSACDPKHLSKSILDMAKWADKIEFALTGKDRQ